MASKEAYLVLENGACFKGQSFGYDGDAEGEIVFNTSMTGYQEILTDPSYKGQIVTLTYPLIGNYGCNPEDVESHQPWVEGLVVKELACYPSSWRKEENLADFLIKNRIPAIQGIDTRKLTRIIRSEGSQKALITTSSNSIQTLLYRVKKIPSIVGCDLVKKVTTSETYRWRKGLYTWPKGYPVRKRLKYFIVAYDFGIKRNILRSLVSFGVDVLVVPAQTPGADILRMKPDGILLSNGPGDPAPLDYVVDNIKNLIGKIPVFGICLGHQLLALALGGKTYKLKFGHHGGNHPVKNLLTNTIEITCQNHSFAVDIDSLRGSARLSHINLNDMTAEGLMLRKKFLFSVQYHPESSPGPQDSSYLFHEFVRMMDNFKGK